jgi:hypothetical protein
MKRRGFLLGSLATGGFAGLRTLAQGAPRQLAAGESQLAADVLVCGGGPAGVAAAALAARQKASVLLLERYGRLGGMAVQGLVGPLMGSCDSPFVRETLARIGGCAFDPNRLDLQYADIVQESGARILLHAWAAETLTEGGRVTGVRAATKQGLVRISARVVVDATGDGDVAFGAGAAFEQGRPGDGRMQPASIMFLVSGMDEKAALLCGSEEQARKVRVPEGTWEEVVTRGQTSGELAATVGVIRIYRSSRAGLRVINATQVNGVDGTKPADLTRAELEGRRQAFQVLEFLRRHAPGYEKACIAEMPAAVGVRETRRILGKAYLTRDDLLAGRRWPEAVVRSASFPIDIHNPAGRGQAEGAGSQAAQGIAARVKPYDIPYGCLVPKDTGGLLTAGRCISGSHEAHASYRVQCIAMGIGAAAGAAAALAAQNGIQPQQVDVRDIQRLLG